MWGSCLSSPHAPCGRCRLTPGFTCSYGNSTYSCVLSVFTSGALDVETTWRRRRKMCCVTAESVSTTTTTKITITTWLQSSEDVVLPHLYLHQYHLHPLKPVTYLYGSGGSRNFRQGEMKPVFTCKTMICNFNFVKKALCNIYNINELTMQSVWNNSCVTFAEFTSGPK